MAWWLNRTGQPEGPYEDQQIFQMIASGQLRGGNICQHGQNAWMPIEQHPGFGAALRGGPPGSPGYAAPQYAPAVKKKTPVGLIIAVVVAGLVVVGASVALLVLKPGQAASAKPLDRKEAEKRAKAFESTLTTLKKIGDADFPLVEDKYTAKVPQPLWDGLASKETATQVIMYETDFDEADLEDGKVLYRMQNSDTAARCLKDLEQWKKLKGTKDPVPGELLENCSGLEHLFVIRVTSLKEPSIANKEGGVTNFEEGSVEGAVAVFDLKSGKSLGGFKYSAKSSDRLEVRAGSEQPDRVLADDMKRRLIEALDAGHKRASSS